MTAPTPRGVREAHQELYGNASVSLEFAAHDLAPENAPFNLAKVRGLIREARESVNLACNALMRAMTPPPAAEREERPPVVTLSWGEYDSLCAALLAARREERALRDALEQILSLHALEGAEMKAIARAALAATPEEK